MNIDNYIRRFGDKTWDELPFNEVDALIFAELSYINFQMVCPAWDEPNPFLRLGDLVIKNRKAFYTGSVDAPFNETMVRLMRKSRRYADMRIGYTLEEFDEKTVSQFFAMTLLFPDDTAYIAYRGTDTSLLGWKEDFLITYVDVIPAQKKSEEYFFKVIDRLPGNVYIGGHSKGGNLALYAALHMTKKYEPRLLKAYSFDGPGFREIKPHLAQAYERVGARIVKYVTKNDVIGMVYNASPQTIIVESTGLLFGGHDPFFWQVHTKTPSFRKCAERSASSKRNEEMLMGWLGSISADDKCLLVDFIFKVFNSSRSVYDLLFYGIHDLASAKTVWQTYPPEERDKLAVMAKKLWKFYIVTRPHTRKSKRRKIEQELNASATPSE